MEPVFSQEKNCGLWIPFSSGYSELSAPVGMRRTEYTTIEHQVAEQKRFRHCLGDIYTRKHFLARREVVAADGISVNRYGHGHILQV